MMQNVVETMTTITTTVANTEAVSEAAFEVEVGIVGMIESDIQTEIGKESEVLHPRVDGVDLEVLHEVDTEARGM